jgi:dihydroorotate dehydrogenase (fumarate)
MSSSISSNRRTSQNDADASMDHSIDLSVTIAGLSFPTCLYNASGPRCGTAEAMAKIAASPATGAVLTKSATLVAQDGNPMPRIHHQSDMLASFNSEGLPNKGIDYYIAEDTIRTVMVDCCTGTNNNSSNDNAADHHKPYIVSLSGKTIADNLEMLRRIFHAMRTNQEIHIAAVELNLACPNIIGKPIIAYDVDQVRDCLTQIKNLYDKEEKEQRTKQPSPSSPNQTIPLLPPLGVKLAPYLDLVLLQKVADVIAQHRSLVRYVVTINTVGNTLPIDGTSAESPYIRPNDGLAGMSGPAITPIALANVWKWRQVLPVDIAVVGVGGIRTGQDVYNMLLAGATACQVGTTHWTEGPTCFDRILSELRDILRNKGIRSVSAVTGSLKPWNAANRPKPTPTAEAAAVATTYAKAKVSPEIRLYQGISILLAVLVAILVADKYNRYHQVG